MANLSLKHIYKVYPNGAKAVNDFNMEIADKEFIVFVGPSGCGKSTTLRMIAGLEDVTAGELKIGDLIVNDMEPKDRDIAMVFQNYALYPHMTVYENIAFGLRLKKIPKDEIHKRVTEAAKILDLTEYLGRKPKEMSGGQRQRVSLGRAIVREPKVMLLDEPLSNLDAKLRTQMREEISKLHSRLQTTFIYVTHDQIEAMTMGTRIVVMKGGFIQQIDTPKNLYDHPANKFVAGFIGTPQMNFFEGTLLKKGEEVEVKFAYSNEKIIVPFSLFYKVRPSYLKGDCPVYIGLRAEDISLEGEADLKNRATVNVKISHKEELGSETLVYGDINMGGDGYSESSTRCIIKVAGDKNLKRGEVVKATLNMQRVHLFDKNTEESILPQIPQFNYLDCNVQNNGLRFLGEEIALPPAISLNDCSAELIVPTDAINLNGTILAKVICCEPVLNKYVLTLEVGGGIMYAISQNEVTSDYLKIGFDFKKISIISQDNIKILPMPQTVSFFGKLVKHKSVKTVDINGKRKNKKVVSFKLLIEGSLFDVRDEIAQKIISVLGVRRAFLTNLRFDCSPYDVSVSTDGIKARFIKTLDYGKEKFALCKVGINDVYVYINDQPADNICLAPIINSLSIIQADINVKIV